ncbi:MAG: hypothetical protein K1X35_09705 [Caulobacteraceae bacterium]|nr:hypothetical protein [Caulobacteraceae bacterium]
MTDAAATARRKGSRIMWAVTAALFAVCLAAVGAAAVVYQLDLGKPAFAAALVVVGLSLEATFWCAAAAIGVSVFEARKRLWRFIIGRGWPQA